MEDAHAVYDDLWAAGGPTLFPASAVERPACAFYGIYDGHGGKRAATFAASHLHLSVREKLQLLSSEEFENSAAVKHCLRDAFHETEAEWAARAKARQMCDGSTAVTALVVGDRLFVSNLGDSRLIICGEGGSVRFATRDHKPDLPSEEKRIRAAGGFVKKMFGVARVNGDLALSRAFGDIEYKEVRPGKGPIVSPEPDITEYHLSPDDRFMVLACDGLWDVYSNGKVGELVWAWLATGTRPRDVAPCLVRRAILERDQHDNVSAITVSFWQAWEGPAGPPKGKRRHGRGSPCPSPGLPPADAHRAAGPNPLSMEPLPETAAAKDCPSPKAHRHRHRGRAAGLAPELEVTVAAEVDPAAVAGGDSAEAHEGQDGQGCPLSPPVTVELSPRASDGEDATLLSPASRRSGHHRRRRAKAKVHTCAPPPGSAVVDGITTVPAPVESPDVGGPDPTGPKEYGCCPPPGSEVVAGITYVPALPANAVGQALAGPRLCSCSPPPGCQVVDGVTIVPVVE
eukprot:EG_transcript_7695